MVIKEFGRYTTLELDDADVLALLALAGIEPTPGSKLEVDFHGDGPDSYKVEPRSPIYVAFTKPEQGANDGGDQKESSNSNDGGKPPVGP